MHKPGTLNTIFKSFIPWHCCIYYEEYVAMPLINLFMEVAGSVTNLKKAVLDHVATRTFCLWSKV